MSKASAAESNLSICFSCRHYPVVALEHGLTICVERENCHDIATYVQAELEPSLVHETKAQELQDEVVARAAGVFQWVVLIVPTILRLCRQGRPLKMISKKVREMPKELHNVYQALLDNVDKEDYPQSLQLIQWVHFALRPLTLKELRFAMTVDADVDETPIASCHDSAYFVETDDQMEKRVISLSGGLVEVREHGEEHVAQFIHQSVIDYMSGGGLRYFCSSPTNVVGRGHLQLLRSCIKYIAMEDMGYWSNRSKWDIEVDRDIQQRFPFLLYATTFWTSHAQIVEEQQTSQENLLQLFGFDFCRRWIHAYRSLCTSNFDRPVKYAVAGTTLLHVASRHGLLSIANAILATGDIDKDCTDSSGWTAILYAIVNGQDAIIQLLLTHGAKLDSGSRLKRRKMLDTTGELSIKTVELLLQQGFDFNSVIPNDATLFTAIVKRGDEALVERLIENGTNLNVADNNSWTPLMMAATMKHDEI
ncbi:hypothetical protein B0A49_05693, partial [Cryomyces minteri]